MLSRTKRDTIWTKTPSKPKGTPRCDKKWSSKLQRNPNQQMIDSITKGIKSTQQMIDKTPIENKIPIKTTNINLGEEIPRRR